MAKTNVNRVKTSDLELKDRLVSIQRVTKVTKGGRHFRFAAIVVVGDEKGVVGYGLGKANEVTAAIQKGVEDAKKNLVKIPLINTTIPHEQVAKFIRFDSALPADMSALISKWRDYAGNMPDEED